MQNATDLKRFHSQIYRAGILIALLFELLSLPFLGFDPRFAYGLALGTVVAVANYSLLAYVTARILNRGKGAALAVLGYLGRLALYGWVFYTSYQIDTTSGLATLLGYMTLKLGMYYVYGFQPKFSKSSTEGKKFNDLDQDQWALEQAEKAKTPRWTQKILTIFHDNKEE
jgi:hypothetical protein